jgi:hypothetical protein
LQTVFGDVGPDPGHVEDLTDLHACELGAGEIAAAVRAHRGYVDDHLVGVSHLGEVLPFCTGLLSLTAPLGPALLSVGSRRLGEPLGRWRHRRVARVAPESLFEVGEMRFEHADPFTQKRDLLFALRAEQLEGRVELLRILIGGLIGERGEIVGRNS